MDKGYIFISGISSGIGYATTAHLLDKGYHVIGSVRKEQDRERLLGTFKERLTCLLFDVRDYESMEAVKPIMEEVLGPHTIRGLINNAGIALPGPLELIPDEEFEQQMAVNVNAVRKLTNMILPYMKEGKPNLNPRIIFISSVSGRFAAPFNGPYCISKHALECMVDIYRRELMIYGIDVISVQPGPIKTRIWQKTRGKFDRYTDTVYGSIALKADRIISHSEENAMEPSIISALIQDILEADRVKTRYLVHRNKALFRLLADWLPDRWVDKLIWKNLHSKDSNTYRPV